jgi:hypothetical protein
MQVSRGKQDGFPIGIVSNRDLDSVVPEGLTNQEGITRRCQYRLFALFPYASGYRVCMPLNGAGARNVRSNALDEQLVFAINDLVLREDHLK